MADVCDSPPQRFSFVYYSQVSAHFIIICKKAVSDPPLSKHPPLFFIKRAANTINNIRFVERLVET